MNRQDVSGIHALAQVVVAASDRVAINVDKFLAGYTNPSPVLLSAIDALKKVSADANGDLLHIVAGLRASQPYLVDAIEKAAETYAVACLRKEFDDLVARMNTPEAKAASRALFEMSGEEMGKAALRAVEERKAKLTINKPLIEKMLGRPVDWSKTDWTAEERGEK